MEDIAPIHNQAAMAQQVGNDLLRKLSSINTHKFFKLQTDFISDDEDEREEEDENEEEEELNISEIKLSVVNKVNITLKKTSQ